MTYDKNIHHEGGRVMKVAVYCGSHQGKRPTYMETATKLGRALAKQGHQLVYGGSNVGLMGAMANEAITSGAYVIGVMPEHLSKREVAHSGLSEIHLVESMHVRKKMMADLADAYIAMPGGCGTLDEYFEIFTWAQIGLHEKPVILLNVDGFYDALLQHFERMIEDGFVREEHREILKVANSVEELQDLLK